MQTVMLPHSGYFNSSPAQGAAAQSCSGLWFGSILVPGCNDCKSGLHLLKPLTPLKTSISDLVTCFFS